MISSEAIRIPSDLGDDIAQDQCREAIQAERAASRALP